MPTSSSSAQAAQQRLAGQLRDLRLAAGLSGREFAAAAGCQASKVSQIEKAARPASMADVKLWCLVWLEVVDSGPELECCGAVADQHGKATCVVDVDAGRNASM